MRSTDAILNEVLALPVSERARLARQLIDSLDKDTHDTGVEEAWADEIEKRVQALERGEAKTVSADEAFAWIEEQRRRKKA
jgi:putative addiction module component (TIGR02574 family)